jgi:hypothetical protein
MRVEDKNKVFFGFRKAPRTFNKYLKMFHFADSGVSQSWFLDNPGCGTGSDRREKGEYHGLINYKDTTH